jgi:hypothetical protein
MLGEFYTIFGRPGQAVATGVLRRVAAYVEAL